MNMFRNPTKVRRLFATKLSRKKCHDMTEVLQKTGSCATMCEWKSPHKRVAVAQLYTEQPKQSLILAACSLEIFFGSSSNVLKYSCFK